MDVKKIPTDVQSLLSASAKVNNYRRAVEELVYNALDAESTSIAIRIHIENNWIQVVDNGMGIKAADYKLLGERYATSKLFDINNLKAVSSKYGYQGQALANIIEVSKVVKITSRCADSNDTWVKTFLEGKIERECFTAPMKPSKGTTIEISGFLYNLNIQNKCINAFNELEDIKKFLQQLLLVFNNVSISLRDDSENEIIFKMHKTKDIYQSLKFLFDIDANDFQELQVEKNDYKVKAFIVDKKDVKNVQWIYLNNKFVNASNLHKIINHKFGNPNGTRCSKVKTKGKHNEENFGVYDFVPPYFIFITCPCNEYNIFNDIKQTTIEFQNWVNVNKIIEKLVKFYNGDINLVTQEKIDQKQVSAKLTDTRDEVKKIIEIFLEKNKKRERIFQMKNGVKGKQIKRKRKKQKLNNSISFTKIIPPKSISPAENAVNSDNGKVYKNKVTKKMTNSNQLKIMQSGYCGPNNQPKPRKKGILKSKAKHRNIKISKSLKCKCKKTYDNVIEMFKNETNSIKKRCNEVSSYINGYFNIKDCRKLKDTSITQPKYKNSLMNTNITDVANFKQLSKNRRTEMKQIKSYDLLQTIINTQQDFYNQEERKKDVLSHKPNIQRHTYSKMYFHGPKLTFESHHYSKDNAFKEKILQNNVKLTSNQSIKHFNIDADMIERSIQNKTYKYSKLHDFDNKTEKRQDLRKFNKLLKIYDEDEIEEPLSIDISGTNIIEVSKQIRNQVMKDMNLLFDSRDCDNIYKNKSKFNFGINLNIEKTFTILVDSFYNSSQVQPINVPTKRKGHIDETVSYTNVKYHDTTHSDNVYKTSVDIFESESLHMSKADVVEPLDVCEAILNSSHKGNDLNNLYNDILPLQNSSLNLMEYQNSNEILMDNGINKLETDFSESKSPQKNCLTLAASKENDINKGTLEVVHELLDCKEEKIQEVITVSDNSIYSFKLNSRHRFVPKGMSQIFKNCHSKNICSYNLDDEYYENAIYNNFVEEVAVNSEIYKPKVQNLKEFATENIQKATEKVLKHNADLIFGSDSLRSAKVVLGQVDSKFIAAIIQGVSERHKSPEFLVFFDQHAVHERIRLEKNLSYYVNDNVWKKTTIDAITLKCCKDDILYLHNHKDKFTRFGFEWTILNNTEIFIKAIPQAIHGKNTRPMEVIIKAIQDFILEQVYSIKHLKGNVSLYPQSIMKLVFSEACRYAIKFGDNLSKKDCIELIAELANCKTPFQCAHGRPVMAVMLELKNEHFEYKISMDNIKQFKNRTKKY